MNERAAINDNRKAELLSTQVEHVDITSFDARPIVEAMGKMSFTSRDLARATGIYNQMLSDPDCAVILVVAGSTSAGGCVPSQNMQIGTFSLVMPNSEKSSAPITGSRVSTFSAMATQAM